MAPRRHTPADSSGRPATTRETSTISCARRAPRPARRASCAGPAAIASPWRSSLPTSSARRRDPGGAELPGAAELRIRAGIHIGPVSVEKGDVFGRTVNFASRVIGAITGSEIWVSEQAKGDIDALGAGHHQDLQWERHEDMEVKGFVGGVTLWSLVIDQEP